MRICKRTDKMIAPDSNWPELARTHLLIVMGCIILLMLAGPPGTRPATALQCPLDSCNTACTTTYWATSWNHWYESLMPIKYYINKDGAANCTGNAFTAVQRGAMNWERVVGNFWATCYVDTTSKHSSADHGSPARDTVNVVSWEDLGGGSPLLLGYGYSWYSTSGDSIVEADISLNNNAAVKWSALKADSCVPGKFDVEDIATHEFGHWMFLYHSCDMGATMYCWADSNETKKRSPSDCDIMAMQAQYPQSAGQPKVQPGWWPVSVGADVNSNPVLGDVNRDGNEEVVVAGGTGGIHVYTGRGEELYGWPKCAGAQVDGSPALGDVDSDGWLEIAVGSVNDSIYVFGHSGARITAVGTGGDVHSTPAIGDLDKDGSLDVVCSSEDSKVYAFKSNGNAITGWPVTLGGNIPGGGPALADLNGDDSLEVVTSGYDFKVYALKPHGANLTGWPVSTGRKVRERVAIGDIDGDSQYEVVATSESDSAYAWNKDGSRCSGWPVYVASSLDYAAPSLGDIDGDGSPEIVFGSDGDSVYAFNGNGSKASGWPKYVDGKVRGSVLIVDIDQDAEYEVVAVTDNGKIYAFNGNGTNVNANWWPKTYGGTGYQRSPAIGDANGDSELDIFVGSTDTDKIYAYSLGSTPSNNTYEWRMYGHDWNRTSRYGFAPTAPVPVLFTDLIANLDHWQRWGVGGASINLSTMSYSPPYSMGVSGSSSPGAYAGAFSEYVDADFAKPYILKFYFTYSNFYTANWIVFGHARFRLASPTAPVYMDRAGDWSNLIPMGPAFNSYCPAGVFTEFEIRVDPSQRLVMLFVNGSPLGTGQYDYTVVPSNRVWLEDREYPGEFLTGWYDDFEVRGYMPVVGVESEVPPTPPLVNVLYQSYPNPMNPMATIKYSIMESGRVTLRIYDVAGRVIKELVNEEKQASLTPYSVVWNGTDDSGRRVASGVYFYRMEAKNYVSAKKIVILR
jgi:hypothetical protein